MNIKISDLLIKQETTDKMEEKAVVAKKDNNVIQNELAMGCCCEECVDPCTNPIEIPFGCCIYIPDEFQFVEGIDLMIPKVAFDEQCIHEIQSLCKVEGTGFVTDPCGVEHECINCEICLCRHQLCGCIKYLISVPNAAEPKEGGTCGGTAVDVCCKGCECIDPTTVCYSCGCEGCEPLDSVVVTCTASVQQVANNPCGEECIQVSGTFTITATCPTS